MKFLIAVLLISSSVLAGGGGSQPYVFSECVNKTGEKLSILFADGRGYSLYSLLEIDPPAHYLNAKDWTTQQGGFKIEFKAAQLQAEFRSSAPPFKSPTLTIPGRLTVISALFNDGNFTCLHR